MSITSSFFSVGIPLESNAYLFKFIPTVVPSAFVIVPTGIQTNWLPEVAPVVASSITIPLSTVVASSVTLNPAGITILFPFSSCNSVLSVAFKTLPC